MRYFTVTAHPKRIQVDEQIKEPNRYDYSAIVDGETCRYKINKNKNISKQDKQWKDRAIVHIHYHAYNLGQNVRFEPTYYSVRRESKISEKQTSIW